MLVLKLDHESTLVVGALGAHRFPAGTYLYVGSAFGPGGLRGRLAHHLRPVQRPHWHVDYLRRCAVVREIWYSTEPEPRECQWAACLGGVAGARPLVPGFGASDCRCATHLLAFANTRVLHPLDFLPPVVAPDLFSLGASQFSPQQRQGIRSTREQDCPKVGQHLVKASMM